VASLFDVGLYEGYRELHDKLSRARRVKSFSEMLGFLFTGDGKAFSAGETKAANTLATKLMRSVSMPDVTQE